MAIKTIYPAIKLKYEMYYITFQKKKQIVFRRVFVFKIVIEIVGEGEKKKIHLLGGGYRSITDCTFPVKPSLGTCHIQSN